jgi:MutS domain V
VLVEAALTTTTALFGSILFERPADAVARADPSVFADLNLDQVFAAVTAGREEYDLTSFFSVPLRDVQAVDYRHQILRDMEDGVLSGALAEFADRMRDMRKHLGQSSRLSGIADAHAADFRSDGFARFFAMIVGELDDDYFAELEAHLSELAFRRGTLIGAGLGRGLKGTGYVLRRHPEQTWRDRLPGMNKSGYSFVIAERDDAGHRALSELNSQGLNTTANALAQSADHIKDFFKMLRAELGFYLGCLNLRDRLTAKGEPVCFPIPARASLSAHGLYDLCLSLSTDARAVGNDVDADGRQLIMITGANQGGKSTFLRSVGLAQLMMQAGMFVAAKSLTASVSAGIFTHFKREEDAAMEKGKLDEELARMSAITSQIRPGCLLLYNESFASTNEREGSEIARQVIRALTESGIRIVFVTHMYDLAGRYYAEQDPGTLFLRAERRPDGHRTFRLLPGEPLPTSYGEDLYQQVFDGVRRSGSRNEARTME